MNLQYLGLFIDIEQFLPKVIWKSASLPLMAENAIVCCMC